MQFIISVVNNSILLVAILGSLFAQLVTGQILNSPVRSQNRSDSEQMNASPKTPVSRSQFNTIRGQVTDEQEHPLSGYVVEAISLEDEVITYSVKTNQSGKFEFSNLHEGVWSLSVKFFSTMLEQRKVTLSKGMESEVNFAIKATGSVSGFLLDSTSRAPLPIDGDIHLGLLTEWETVERSFRGRASGGSFEVKNLLPGRYVVIDSFPGYVFDMLKAPEVTVHPEGSVGGIEILLKPGAIIHGRLVDENAQPISDLKVKVASDKIHGVRPDRRFDHSTQTDENGKFWLTTPNDPEAYYAFSIIIIDPRYQGQFIHRDLNRGQHEYNLGDIVMRRVLSLTGEVSDLTGESVGQLKVMLKMHNKPVEFFRFAARTEVEVFTDSKGNFVFEELYPTEYSLAVSRNGVTMAFLESVNPQEQPHVEIRLGKTQMLKGRVTNTQYQPLAGARVEVTMRPRIPEARRTQLTSCQTDINGMFQLEVLKTDPALLRVEVSKRGYLTKSYRNVHISREELYVVLEGGASIKGHVFTPPDVPLDGNYSVKLFPVHLPMEPVINPFLLHRPLVSRKYQVSKADFNIGGLLREKYALYVVGDNIGATRIEVDVTSEEQEVTVLVNRSPVVLRGRVLWADTQEPVVEALVSRSWYPWELEIYDLSTDIRRFEVETDEKGTFEFSNLTQGRYILQIRYVDVSFESTSGSYKRNIIRKQVEIPACSKSYIFYLGRRDGRSFVSETTSKSD